MVSKEALQRIFPKANWDELYNLLVSMMEKYLIDTPRKQAAFLAQIGHESGGFVYRVENLNYSASALRKVFGKYFLNDAIAAKYARKPEKIANRVYANRMGNGDEASGDGWNNRGRGFIQITGAYNYLKLGVSLDKTIEEVRVFLETLEGAIESAAWFWLSNRLNGLAECGQFKALTKAINGGLNGYEDRLKLYIKLLPECEAT